MLERFRTAKAAEIASLQAQCAQGVFPTPYEGKRPSFTGSLRTRGIPVIAEYKRASPSKGDINLFLSPEDVAAAYAHAGAGAISVLTEEEYFKGSMAYLESMTEPGLPLLRKDFILHPLQVRQTAASPASAMLVIVRMVDDEMLRTLIETSQDYDLEAVVEIFDETDLQRAREAGAAIIQVNNRDLDTLNVDLTVSKRLARLKQGNEFWITASGMATRQQVCGFLELGFNAALIGGSLMSGSDPAAALSSVIAGA